MLERVNYAARFVNATPLHPPAEALRLPPDWLTWQTDNGIAKSAQLHDIHDLLHKLFFDLSAHRLGQPQESAVGKRLVHRRLRAANSSLI